MQDSERPVTAHPATPGAMDAVLATPTQPAQCRLVAQVQSPQSGQQHVGMRDACALGANTGGQVWNWNCSPGLDVAIGPAIAAVAAAEHVFSSLCVIRSLAHRVNHGRSRSLPVL